MSNLKEGLIKLGASNPELRPHIREILAAKSYDAKKVSAQKAKTLKAVKDAVKALHDLGAAIVVQDGDKITDDKDDQKQSKKFHDLASDLLKVYGKVHQYKP